MINLSYIRLIIEHWPLVLAVVRAIDELVSAIRKVS